MSLPAATASSNQAQNQNSKDAGELKFIVERQEAEIVQLNEELEKVKNELSLEVEKSGILLKHVFDQTIIIIGVFERDLSNYIVEVDALRTFKEKAIEEKEELLLLQSILIQIIDANSIA